MSSLNDLFNRVQTLEEAKVSPVGKQAPVFKDVPKQMKAAGLAASSRDAMIFITQVLSRLDIITPEVYEMTVKGQHRERMEKLMTILRSKEEEINAKSDEIVEYINQNLDNYTAGAGTDRNRAEKYKETAKEISQEVQNIKAGKEADDALRDIVKTADADLVDSLQFGAEDTTTIIEINAGNVANVQRVRSAVEQFANDLGVEVTGNIVEFSVDEGSPIDQMVKKNGVTETEAFLVNHFKGDYPITASIIPPAGAEEKAKVADTVDALESKPEGQMGREHVASVNAAADKFLKSRNIEDAENEAAFDAQKEKVKAMFDQQILDEVNERVKKHADEPGFDHDAEWLAALKSIHSHYKRHEGKDRFAAAERLLAKSDATLAKNVGVEDAEGEHDDNDGEEERCDYVPCEDGEVVEIDPRAMEVIDTMVGVAPSMEGAEYPDIKGMVEAELGRDCTKDECWYLMDQLGVEPDDFEDNEGVSVEEFYDGPDPKQELEVEEDPEFKAAFNAAEDIHGGNPGSGYEEYKEMIEKKLGRPCTDEECDYIEVALDSPNFTNDEADLKRVTESKYTTADSLLDIYDSVKPIVEVVVENTIMNENGQTTHTHQYLVEKAEAAVEEHYTKQYLTEQKASDSLLVTKEEKSESFKERYQPKTSYQLEELRRYGL